MSSSVLAGYKNKLYFLGFWVLWSIMHVWVVKQWHYTNIQAWMDSLISNSLLALTCIFVSLSLKYYLPRKEQPTYLVIMCLAFTALWSGLTRLAFSYLADAEMYEAFNQTFPVRVAIAVLILEGVTLLNVLWQALQDQKEHERRQTEAEQMTRDAELFKLRQQLQPHFLFNSLNSISALVGTKPAEARHMIQQLSDYLRSTLKKDEHKWVSLSEELQYLQLYLDIEKVRFGHRLSTEITGMENNRDFMLPALLLQPVVENAIKFGLYDTIGDITIRIHVYQQDGMICIQVGNPFDAELTQPRSGTGFGLSSVQRRLYLLFGRNDLLQTQVLQQQFITTIKIPQ